ncbi:MAG: hypothetical protein H7067_15655, partial [Burkholderiales bacterium]|nr:hypothetical protein [Opitutaceae bacterium]
MRTPIRQRLALLSLALTASLASAADLVNWPSQYTMRPWETAKLTPADVVGPDGIVYPDFTGVGVTGGIPDVNNPTIRDNYREFNVKTGYGAVGNGTTNDDTAVADATTAALAHVAANAANKAIIYFPAGTYRLSLPLIINRNNVVIDGEGPTSTILRLHTNSAATSNPLPALITFRKPANYSGYLLATEPILRGSNTATFNL